jgi:DNA-binding Lrp family transcriptional regulator
MGQGARVGRVQGPGRDGVERPHILAAKAGRDRVAWISHRTIGEGLGVHRTTVGRAVRKLTKVGVIEDAGKVVVNLRYQSLFQMLNLN